MIPSLNDDRVHIWQIRLDNPDLELRAGKYLSHSERNHAQNLSAPKLRRKYLCSHGALREIMSSYLDIAPNKIIFCKSASGKPKLDETQNHNQLFFNLSHSGELALVGIARGAEIGIDVEQSRPIANILRLADRFFNTEESSALRRTAFSAQQHYFLRQWTGKEALLKARGLGLAGNLRRFSLFPCEQGEEIIIESQHECAAFTVRSLALPPTYVGACAVRSPAPVDFSLLQWN